MTEWKSKANWKDPNWKYTPAAATDISKTIAKIKREMKEQAKQEEEKKALRVVTIKKAAHR